jgi:tellurite resistance protein
MDDPGPAFIPSLEPAQLEALVETMYLVAFADGAYADAERDHFERSVRALTDGKLSGSSFSHLIARVIRDVDRHGRARCVASVKERLDDPQLRQVALILASDMAAADGVLLDSERRAIEAIADAFDMPPDSTREVLEGLTPVAG